MRVSFYSVEWALNENAYVDRHLYDQDQDVLPVIGATIYISKTITGQGMHRIKYRVLTVDWSVSQIDGDVWTEVQVRLLEIK